MKVALKQTGCGAARLLPLLASLLIGGCASTPAPTAAPAPAIVVPALAYPADGVELRRPPRIAPGSLPHVDYYPMAEHRASVGGRVLVQFGIDAAGKATSAHVVQASATRDLQSAALNIVRALKFNLTDPHYNSADLAPNYLLINFCIEQCNFPPGFPAEEVTLTGSKLKTP